MAEADFCDKCEIGEAEAEVCEKLRVDFFRMIKDAFAQRDALLTDLNLACGGKFVDVCCICGHYTPENPGEKCELKGLDCRWEWRGLQHG
jgi:hypothetical protein